MRRWPLIVLGLAALVPGPQSAEARAVTERVDLAPVWSGHPVNFAIDTTGDFQCVAFYDPERQLTVAARRLDSTEWQFSRLPQTLGWDSHNGVALAIDRSGFIHVSGNMHSSPLIYYRSRRAYDVSDFDDAAMLDELEESVTYPVFLRDEERRLVFQYRHGRSGDGVQIFNRYDEESRSWTRLLDRPLLDGLERSNAYLTGPVVGPDGYFHLVWLWRDSPSGDDNHDLSYARSRDLVHWETVGGTPLRLPLTPRTQGVVVDPVGPGNGLAGIAFGVGWDDRTRPVVTYSKYDTEGHSQAFNARWEEAGWRIYQTSDWSYRWNLDRTGTLAADVVALPLQLDAEGRLVQWFRHVEDGEHGWVVDPETLQPTAVVERPEWWQKLRRPEGREPGLEVREFIFDRSGRYFLRWETLPVNRDRRRRGRYPPPSLLRVYGVGEGPELELDREASPATDALDPAVLEAEQARVGRIIIHTGDIFAPEEIEDRLFLYNLINRLHYTTRDEVIREQLVFVEGDLFSQRLLEESERILRSRKYLYDATIRPVAYRDGLVDLEVTTRDVWTLTGGASLSRGGGENEVRFSLDDTNFIGTGTDLGVEYRDTVDRTESTIQYRDKNLRGSWAQIEAVVSDNSDGERYLLKLIRPFFSLESKWSAGVVVELFDRVDPFFELGKRTAEFRHQFDFFETWWGWSRGLEKGRVWRFKTGYTYNSNTFAEAAGRAPPPALPPDRTQSFPWIEIEYLEDKFLEIRNLDQLQRTEDVLLGKRFQARVGWSSPEFGGDESRILMGSGAGLGLRPGPDKLLLTSLNLGGRWKNDDLETLVAGGGVRFFWRNWNDHLLTVELFGDYARNLDEELQLLLGGDSGLRGYPLRYQSGNRRFLFRLEQRFFTDREFFKVANLGAAVFFDAGRAWFAGSGAPEDLGILKDIGFGLRLSSGRSGRGNVLHLDVAFPLDRDGDIESVQWLVSTKETL